MSQLLHLGDDGGADAVPAGVADARGGAAGVAVEVGPRALEQLAGDDGVGVAVGDEDRQSVEAAGGGGDAGVEGQGAEQDRGAGVAVRVVEDQPAGERGAAAEPDEDDRPVRPGATSSSQLRNHAMVVGSDSATGRPMPRLANQA